MENISFNALNSLPLPLLCLVYFTLFLALLTIGFSVYLKITHNWYKVGFAIAFLLMKVKSSIRKWFLRQPTTRYNMVDYPSSDTQIQLESLDEPNPAQPLSESNTITSEIQPNKAEQVSELNGKKMRVKKLKNGKIIYSNIS